MEKTFEFWETFKDSNANVWHNRNEWIKVAAGPWIISLLVLVIGFILMTSIDIPVIPESGGDVPDVDVPWSYIIGSLVTGIAAFAATIIFTIRAYRYRLLGEVPADYISFEWGMRHWLYAGFLIAIMIGFAGTIALVGYAAGPLVAFLIGIALFFLSARFMLFGPIISVDGGNPFSMSWKLTSNWVWLKLLALFIFVALPAGLVLGIVGVIFGLLFGDFFSQIISQLFTNYVIGAIMSSALASVYAQLVK